MSSTRIAARLGIPAALFAACATPSADDAKPPLAPAAVVERADEAHWTILFDGTTLDGWESISYGGEGPVELVDGALRLGMGSMLTGVRYPDVARLPKQDYELELVAARLAGTDFFCGLTFPVGDSFATLVLGGWGGALTGLSCIDGLDASDNETKSYRRYEKGRDYAVHVRVTAERVQAWIDGESVVDAARAGRRFSLRTEVVKSQPLSVSSYATLARVRSLRLRALVPR